MSNGEKLAHAKHELGKMIEAYDSGALGSLDSAMLRVKHIFEKLHNGEH